MQLSREREGGVLFYSLVSFNPFEIIPHRGIAMGGEGASAEGNAVQELWAGGGQEKSGFAQSAGGGNARLHRLEKGLP